MTVVAGDVRFTVPLYTSAEAAGYLGVRPTTFAGWVTGRRPPAVEVRSSA